MSVGLPIDPEDSQYGESRISRPAAIMTSKQYHEIRDPIHDFARLDSDERRVLDSGPLQRLRHIHQLAMSYLVYPGATHKRFEHSLGVMELAGRVFDVVTADHNIHPSVREVVPEIARSDSMQYWRKVLRMAALCHDIGHLPFSHAAEKELLPEGWNHERFTANLIEDDELRDIWCSMRPPLVPLDVAKISVGPEKMQEVNFTNWEALLSEIIIGDALGVDRMDYLLRDSHHTGVAYGKFDHHRLVDTMRILPDANEESKEPTLGVEIGGIHSSEALLLARYFMFVQVYHHNVRVAYDFHLKQFLQTWLPDSRFSIDAEVHQKLTDNEVLAELTRASRDPSSLCHEAAVRIVNRKHFRHLYTPSREDKTKYGDPLAAVFGAVASIYGEDRVYKSEYTQPTPDSKFPVHDSEGNVVSSHEISNVLPHIPIVDVGAVLVAPEIVKDTSKWLGENRESILSANSGE